MIKSGEDIQKTATSRVPVNTRPMCSICKKKSMIVTCWLGVGPDIKLMGWCPVVYLWPDPRWLWLTVSVVLAFTVVLAWFVCFRTVLID